MQISFHLAGAAVAVATANDDWLPKWRGWRDRPDSYTNNNRPREIQFGPNPVAGAVSFIQIVSKVALILPGPILMDLIPLEGRPPSSSNFGRNLRKAITKNFQIIIIIIFIAWTSAGRQLARPRSADGC